MISLPQNLDLDNREFEQAYRLLSDTAANVFLTGKAGTGKSTFLRYICENLKKNYVVLAPTGVAAVNVGGVTIHSFFQMPLRPVPPDDPAYSVAALINSRKYSRQKRKLIKELELIIIDEVSMVRADMIDFIDRALRALTERRGLPFGGVQMLLVGDIFQLEPVVTPDTRAILSQFYPDFFFFNARAYQRVSLVAIELRKIYRQTDSRFIDLLDRIRINRSGENDFQLLNSRVGNRNDVGDEEEGFAITLASRRDTVAMINRERMECLPGEETTFSGKIEGEFPEKILPTDLDLVLKPDAQVMLVRNDRDHRWVNGTLARILEFRKDHIMVELENGKEVRVEQETWDNITYTYDEKEKKIKEEVLGSFTQYPLKAAWALTIHKSQGLTFSKVTIDMEGGAFSAGQTYVALSRCRSLEGISFVNPLKRSDVIVSAGAAEFSTRFNDAQAAERALKASRAASLSQEAKQSFSRGDMSDAVEKVWEVNTLTGSLAQKSVRRLISSSLSEVASLRRQLAENRKRFRELAREFTSMGEMCLDNPIQPEAALANFEKALSLDSTCPDATIGKAKALVELSRYKEADATLSSLSDRKNQAAYEALLLKGDIKVMTNDAAGAVLNYMSASKLRPRDPEPIERIIKAYEEAGMDDKADDFRDFLDELDEQSGY